MALIYNEWPARINASSLLGYCPIHCRTYSNFLVLSLYFLSYVDIDQNCQQGLEPGNLCCCHRKVVRKMQRMVVIDDEGYGVMKGNNNRPKPSGMRCFQFP
jgi:hypothetical protein